MALLSIIVAPDHRLKAISQPIAVFDREARKLADDMLETMYDAPGIGLAAIQVGAARRLIVVDIARDPEPPSPYVLFNPRIVSAAAETVHFEEGCLSLPDQFAEVVRPGSIVITYQDLEGTPRRLEASGLLATCIQHEMDHLEGVLFVDHLSAVRRSIILRKLVKARRAEASA
ncbi:MAG: peptide deformylase [Alphaproteobacteria bacterium]|nr:peptide deformylase [Alphaproteobacteria bacterium]